MPAQRPACRRQHRPGRTRRLPGAGRQLRRLPHGARRRALCRRPRLGTPFGSVVAGNLTPDDGTGLGRWSADHFWRALHEGRRSTAGRLSGLPVHRATTRVTRADSDAPLRLPAQPAAGGDSTNRRTRCAFPTARQPRWPVWRALYFRPGSWPDDPAQGADWNRGAYLVQRPGPLRGLPWRPQRPGRHRRCGFGGGLIPAPQLVCPGLHAGRRGRRRRLAGGRDRAAAAGGPGAARPGHRADGRGGDCKARSICTTGDLRAIAVYLKSLPQQSVPPTPAVAGASRRAPRWARACTATTAPTATATRARAGCWPAVNPSCHRWPATAWCTMAPAVNLVRAITARRLRCRHRSPARGPSACRPSAMP